MRRRTVAVVVVVVLLGAVALLGVSGGLVGDPVPSAGAPAASTTAGPSASAPSAPASDDIRALFDGRRSDVEVQGSGTVARLLADDDDGSRHQRFILRLDDGLTVLIAHNVDLAPRLDGLGVGDRVEFRGEYVWSDLGGTVHWTHHDPTGRHAAGWLRWAGRSYA